MNLTADGDTALIGEFEITADFEESLLSGAVYNLYNEESFVLEGSLDIQSSEFVRYPDDVSLFDAPLSGELNDANSNYVVDGSVSGEIYNEDPIVIDGKSAGTLTIDGEEFTITGGRWLGETQ